MAFFHFILFLFLSVQDGNVSVGMKLQNPCGSPVYFTGIHSIRHEIRPSIDLSEIIHSLSLASA